MDFTELYNHSNGLVAFSQGAHFILTAVHDRLIVRRADTFQISRSWQVDTTPSPSILATVAGTRRPPEASPISHIGWSSDSEYILAACAKLCITHVFCMRDEQWHASIEAGAEGLAKAEWAADGRHILCFSEWGLRVTVWSLLTGTPTYIQYPVHPDRGYAFRRDGRYFILAERHKSKDTVGVYDTANSYSLVRHYSLPTSSMASISISPTGNHLAVWEGPLEYKLYILSLTGRLLGAFKPESDPGLGIRSVAWHPTGMFIAVAGWDDKIYILEHLTWSKVATLTISARTSDTTSVWREPDNWLVATEGRGFLSYERLRSPHTIPSIRPASSKAYPKTGTGQLEFNKTGTILMARFEHMPTAIHLFSFPAPGETFAPRLRSVLIHSQPVIHARWNPFRTGNLAATCGNSALYIWSDEWVSEGGEAEEMAECVGIPAKNFEARDVRWAPDGKGVALVDRETFCCAFEVTESA